LTLSWFPATVEAPPSTGARLDPDREDQVTSTSARRASTGPALSEVVDGVAGKVTVTGQLTPQGADLLRGTVEGLRRLGHSTVVVDLAALEVDGAGEVHALSDLTASMAATGTRLLLQHVPPELRAGS
jgi:anti-anti-sigma regulatory factor